MNIYNTGRINTGQSWSIEGVSIRVIENYIASYRRYVVIDVTLWDGKTRRLREGFEVKNPEFTVRIDDNNHVFIDLVEIWSGSWARFKVGIERSYQRCEDLPFPANQICKLMKGLYDSVINALKTQVEGLINNVNETAEELKGFTNSFYDTYVQPVQDSIDNAQERLGELGEHIDYVQAWAEGARDGLLDLISGAQDDINKRINTLEASIEDRVSDSLEYIIERFLNKEKKP